MRELKFSVIMILILLGFVSGCSICRSKTTQPTVMDLLGLGDHSFEEAEYEKALDFYNQAARIEPENPVIYYKVGLVYGNLHSLEHTDRSVISGKADRLSRVEFREESNYQRALYYFGKAADLGHRPSRDILRVMYDNIQHRDVQY